MAKEMDEGSDRLLLTMASLGELLRHAGDSWADSAERCRDRIERGDRWGLDSFLGIFAGMGSFNDVLICPENGHSVSDAEVDSVNREFLRLKLSAWEDATALKRYLDRS